MLIDSSLTDTFPKSIFISEHMLFNVPILSSHTSMTTIRSILNHMVHVIKYVDDLDIICDINKSFYKWRAESHHFVQDTMISF